MTRVADLTHDGKQRVEMYYRIGKALDEKLGDRGQAQERYEMALDLDPSHLPTLGGPAPDRDRQRRLGQGRALPRSGAAQHAGAARSARKLLVELGRLRDETLGEHDAASRPTSSRCSATPTTRTRRCRSSTEYINREKWAEAEPLADLLVRKGGQARAPRAAHAVQHARTRRDARSARTTRRSRPTKTPTSSISPIGETIRASPTSASG